MDEIASDEPARSSVQFGLGWLLYVVAILSLPFAIIATKGHALFIVFAVAVLAPVFVLAYIVFLWLRPKFYAVEAVPLASTLRDPLGIDEDERAQSKELEMAFNAEDLDSDQNLQVDANKQ